MGLIDRLLGRTPADPTLAASLLYQVYLKLDADCLEQALDTEPPYPGRIYLETSALNIFACSSALRMKTGIGRTGREIATRLELLVTEHEDSPLRGGSDFLMSRIMKYMTATGSLRLSSNGKLVGEVFARLCSAEGDQEVISLGASLFDRGFNKATEVLSAFSL